MRDSSLPDGALDSVGTFMVHAVSSVPMAWRAPSA